MVTLGCQHPNNIETKDQFLQDMKDELGAKNKVAMMIETLMDAHKPRAKSELGPQSMYHVPTCFISCYMQHNGKEYATQKMILTCLL